MSAQRVGHGLEHGRSRAAGGTDAPHGGEPGDRVVRPLHRIVRNAQRPSGPQPGGVTLPVQRHPPEDLGPGAVPGARQQLSEERSGLEKVGLLSGEQRHVAHEILVRPAAERGVEETHHVAKVRPATEARLGLSERLRRAIFVPCVHERLDGAKFGVELDDGHGGVTAR